MPLEINPVVADPEPVQGAAGPFELAEGVQVGVQDLLGQPAELAENLELKFLGHARQFGRAGGIKDDLKRRHGSGAAASPRAGGRGTFKGQPHVTHDVRCSGRSDSTSGPVEMAARTGIEPVFQP